MNGLEAEFTKFSAEQRAKLNARIEDVRSSLASLEQQVETFGTLKEGLQEVQTDIALLKPLGLMLEKVEAQLESTHAEVETLIDRMAANKRELGNFDKTLGGIKATQREMGGQIDHLVKTVDFIEKGMVERIHAEVRLAKESIKQLEQTLKLLEPIQIHQKIETSVSEPTG
ncbi:MAG: hypothetical protein NPIRA02_11770 [Nitrospirales bacterium]|nr:MAG: hypothetical protein NPIRA02_11770 [Nitrospirales bacterium]